MLLLLSSAYARVSVPEHNVGSLVLKTRRTQKESTCTLQALLQRWAASCCTGADGMAAALQPQLPALRQPVASVAQPQAQVKSSGILRNLQLQHVMSIGIGRSISSDRSEDKVVSALQAQLQHLGASCWAGATSGPARTASLSVSNTLACYSDKHNANSNRQIYNTDTQSSLGHDSGLCLQMAMA